MFVLSVHLPFLGHELVEEKKVDLIYFQILCGVQPVAEAYKCMLNECKSRGVIRDI